MKSLLKLYVTKWMNILNLNNVSPKSRKMYKNSKPYWNDDLTSKWKQMVEDEKKFKRFKGHRSQKNRLKLNFDISRDVFDKSLRQAERKYNNNIVLNIEQMSHNNPKQFWKKIKDMSPKKSDLPTKIEKNGNVITDQKDVLNIWKTDFEDLYNPKFSTTNEAFMEEIKSEISDMENSITLNTDLNKPIEVCEVHKAIRKCKAKKAPGIDKIPNEVIQHPNMCYLLFKLFSFCFEKHIVPSLWLKSVVRPIPKSSDKNPYVPLNYRGISLISCIGKIYSSILDNRLISYLDENNILVDEQNGFRKSRSCEDHIFTLSSIIKDKKMKNKSVFAAFIDMSKAFDCINRSLLLYKLLKNNINGNLYLAISALYNETLSCVQINNIRTDWFVTNQGVRQGDNLSPTLFNIYINDLALELKKMNLGVTIGNLHVCILLYADDIVLISESEQNLQIMLDFVNSWCNKWQMKINNEKSKIVHFGRKTLPKTSFEFKVGCNTLEVTDSYTYLGIIFDEFLTFEKCAKTLSDLAGRALSAVISKFKRFRNIGFNTFTKLYYAGVNTILDNGASVWGFSNHKFGQRFRTGQLNTF